MAEPLGGSPGMPGIFRVGPWGCRPPCPLPTAKFCPAYVCGVGHRPDSEIPVQPCAWEGPTGFWISEMQGDMMVLNPGIQLTVKK